MDAVTLKRGGRFLGTDCPHHGLEQVVPATWRRFKDAAAQGRIGNAPENLGIPRMNCCQSISREPDCHGEKNDHFGTRGLSPHIRPDRDPGWTGGAGCLYLERILRTADCADFTDFQ